MLELDDDAPGPPPAARQLRLHADRLAAELDVAADPDGGMTVRARIPLPS